MWSTKKGDFGHQGILSNVWRAFWLSQWGCQGSSRHVVGGDQGQSYTPHSAQDAPIRVLQPQMSIIQRLRNSALKNTQKYLECGVYMQDVHTTAGVKTWFPQVDLMLRKTAPMSLQMRVNSGELKGGVKYPEETQTGS